MNQITIGKFICLKRKQKNLTQEQLAEKLNISNKTISKWENGNCMPDYSIIKELCNELDITVNELIDGKEQDKKNETSNDDRILDLLRRTQELENQKQILYGLVLVAIGIGMQGLSHTIDGSNFKDFISGILLGLSIVEMLAGIYIVGKSIALKK